MGCGERLSVGWFSYVSEFGVANRRPYNQRRTFSIVTGICVSMQQAGLRHSRSAFPIYDLIDVRLQFFHQSSVVASRTIARNLLGIGGGRILQCNICEAECSCLFILGQTGCDAWVGDERRLLHTHDEVGWRGRPEEAKRMLENVSAASDRRRARDIGITTVQWGWKCLFDTIRLQFLPTGSPSRANLQVSNIDNNGFSEALSVLRPAFRLHRR